MNADFEAGRDWGRFTERFAEDGGNDDRDRTSALAEIIGVVDRAEELDVEHLTLAEIRKALLTGWLSAYDPGF